MEGDVFQMLSLMYNLWFHELLYLKYVVFFGVWGVHVGSSVFVPNQVHCNLRCGDHHNVIVVVFLGGMKLVELLIGGRAVVMLFHVCY